jgi:xanthine dehydrogenase YagS FAD-binding subunit
MLNSTSFGSRLAWIAPVPLRFERVENAPQSRRVDDAAIEQAAGLAIEGARPLPQTGYKLQVLQPQIADLLRPVTAVENPRLSANMMWDESSFET